jgi:hypothetical protein
MSACREVSSTGGTDELIPFVTLDGLNTIVPGYCAPFLIHRENGSRRRRKQRKQRFCTTTMAALDRVSGDIWRATDAISGLLMSG